MHAQSHMNPFYNRITRIVSEVIFCWFMGLQWRSNCFEILLNIWTELKLTIPFSSQLHNITIPLQLYSQIILQKSSLVAGRGPCVAMNSRFELKPWNRNIGRRSSRDTYEIVGVATIFGHLSTIKIKTQPMKVILTSDLRLKNGIKPNNSQVK